MTTRHASFGQICGSSCAEKLYYIHTLCIPVHHAYKNHFQVLGQSCVAHFAFGLRQASSVHDQSIHGLYLATNALQHYKLVLCVISLQPMIDLRNMCISRGRSILLGVYYIIYYKVSDHTNVAHSPPGSQVAVRDCGEGRQAHWSSRGLFHHKVSQVTMVHGVRITALQSFEFQGMVHAACNVFHVCLREALYDISIINSCMHACMLYHARRLSTAVVDRSFVHALTTHNAPLIANHSQAESDLNHGFIMEYLASFCHDLPQPLEVKVRVPLVQIRRDMKMISDGWIYNNIK